MILKHASLSPILQVSSGRGVINHKQLLPATTRASLCSPGCSTDRGTGGLLKTAGRNQCKGRDPGTTEEK